MDPFIATIMMFAGTFNPRGWALCNGQLLSIAQNTALFSLIGTTYGGNGTTTFGLPYFRGRAPIHWGQGPGLSVITQGQAGGAESVTLLTNNLPAHNHAMTGSSLPGNASLPTGAVPANTGALDKEYSSVLTSNVAMAPTGLTGGGQPTAVRDPYLAVTFIIALEGIFPSRN